MPLLAALLCTRALGGALSAAALPATQAHLADITNDETRTRGMAVLGSAFGLALITGPLLGGLAVY